MFNITIFSLISFIIGVIGTLGVLKILVGGSPTLSEPKCEDGKLKFRVNPNPLQGICKCVGITSTVDGSDVSHDPDLSPSAFHERPFPSSSPVSLTITCRYALFPTDVETAGPTTVQPCSSSSSSSSNSSSSNSSSSSSSSSSAFGGNFSSSSS